jgi:hypothetical protein
MEMNGLICHRHIASAMLGGGMLSTRCRLLRVKMVIDCEQEKHTPQLSRINLPH